MERMNNELTETKQQLNETKQQLNETKQLLNETKQQHQRDIRYLNETKRKFHSLYTQKSVLC